MSNWKNNIYFVLIEPKESGNIGASARAIKNMGFKNLILVKPPSVITDEARWFACNASDVLDAAEIYNNFNDAVNDKSIVIGTTRRTGRRRGIISSVEEGAKKILEIAVSNKIAILFGREDKGLSNEEVERCGLLLNIPTSKKQPSLNLSQAVLIVAYELLKEGNRGYGAWSMKQGASGKEHKAGDRGQWAGNRIQDAEERIEDTEHNIKKWGEKKLRLISHENLSLLYERISKSLDLLGYINQGDRKLKFKIIRNLKHFIGRAGITEWELRMLHGLCSQIEKQFEHKKVNNT